jgi:hypothetical protein
MGNMQGWLRLRRFLTFIVYDVLGSLEYNPDGHFVFTCQINLVSTMSLY